MSAKSTRTRNRSALLASTKLPDDTASTALVVIPTPTIGDNHPPVDNALPSTAEIHASIEATLQSIVSSENAIEYARQKLAYEFSLRHMRMVLTEPADTMPALHTLATSQSVFDTYQAKLAAEFNAASSAKRKDMSDAEVLAYNAKMFQRIQRSLVLLGLLEWGNANNLPCVFNTDKRRWLVAPQCFVPPGWQAAADLLVDPKTKELQASVTLEAENTTGSYFISKPKMAARSISLSLSQFVYAMSLHVKAAQNPTQDVTPTEGTPQAASRAARQQNAAETTTDAASTTTTTTTKPDDDTGIDADKPVNMTDRTWHSEQLAKSLVIAAKYLAMQDMIGIGRADIGNEAWNSMADIAQVYDRINAAEDAATAKTNGKRNAA